MPSVRFTPAMIATIRSQFEPISAPSRVMPPYQMADAIAIGHEGPPRSEADEPGERRHHGAEPGKKPADEDADGAEPQILALDQGERARREQAAAGGSGEEPAPVLPRRHVDGRGAEQVRGPGHQEDGNRGGQSAVGEEGAECHRGVRRNRRYDVLHGGEQGENDVDRRWGKLGEPLQQRFDQRASSVATAITASPSPLPMNPMPSFVLAFTLMAPGASPSRAASAAPMPPRCGPELGRLGDDGEVGLHAPRSRVPAPARAPCGAAPSNRRPSTADRCRERAGRCCPPRRRRGSRR